MINSGSIRVGASLNICTIPSSPTSQYKLVRTKRVVTYLRELLVKQQIEDDFAGALVRSFFPSDGLYGKKPMKLVMKYIVADGADEEDSEVLFHDLEHRDMQWQNLLSKHTAIRIYAEKTDGEPKLEIASDDEKIVATNKEDAVEAEIPSEGILDSDEEKLTEERGPVAEIDIARSNSPSAAGVSGSVGSEEGEWPPEFSSPPITAVARLTSDGKLGWRRPHRRVTFYRDD